VSDESVCPLCQTVNLGGTQLCIACGASFAVSVLGRETAEDDDLDSAAQQPTMIEAAVGGRAAAAPALAVAEATGRSRSTDPSGAEVPPSRRTPGAARFLARLLLPDGDRRSVEIGGDRVSLGSALEDLGVTGDPRVGPHEAWLALDHGDLFVEPQEGALGIYRRLRGEETLADGDVVLMGDIAARYTTLAPAPPVDDGQQVLGGGANSPVGRLVFLRRDGTDGPVHDLPAGKTILGRTDGHVNFPHDGRLSRRHARFFASERGVAVEDLGSRNGTYVRVMRRCRLEVGDALRIGSAGLQIRSIG